MDCRLLAVLPLALVSAAPGPADIPGNGSPDEPVWARPLLASGAQFVNAVHTSAEGDIYVTGYAAGRLDAHGDTLEGEGGGDPFLLKYDAEGRLAWARQGRGPGWSGGRSLATDEQGDVYLGGRFQGRMTLDGTVLEGRGEDDAFVARYSADGSLRWARAIGGAGRDWGNGIAVDEAGRVYLTGVFSGTAEFGDRTVESRGESDLYVAVWDDTGALQWVTTLGGTAATSAWEVAADASGNAYVVGSFAGRLESEAIDDAPEAEGETDGLLVALAPDGSVRWIRTLGGPGAGELESVEVDDEGNPWVAGSFVDGAMLGGRTLKAQGKEDILVAALDVDGGLRRTWTYGGPGRDGLSGVGQSIVVAPQSDGGFWLATAFEESIDLGGGSLLHSDGGPDVFVARFGADGVAAWAAACGGPQFEGFVGLGAARGGRVYLSTNFNSDELRCGQLSVARGERWFGAVLLGYQMR